MLDDIIGLHNQGTIQIGDAFTEGEVLGFTGIPRFAPGLSWRVRLRDSLKSKQQRQAWRVARRRNQLGCGGHAGDLEVQVLYTRQGEVLARGKGVGGDCGSEAG